MKGAARRTVARQIYLISRQTPSGTSNNLKFRYRVQLILQSARYISTHYAEQGSYYLNVERVLNIIMQYIRNVTCVQYRIYFLASFVTIVEKI